MRAIVAGRVGTPVRVLVAALALAGSLLVPATQSSADIRLQMTHTPPGIGWEWVPLRLTAVLSCLTCDSMDLVAHYTFDGSEQTVTATSTGGTGKVLTVDIPAYAVQRSSFSYWLQAIGKPYLCDDLGCYGYDRSPAAGNHSITVARVNLSASPEIFSPYGDGLRETTSFALSTTNGQSVPWTVQVKNDVGTVLRQWTGNGASASITWDGKDALGATVQEGFYSVHALNTNTGLPVAPKINVQAASNQCDVLPPLSAWTQDIERTINCNLQSTLNSLEAKYGGTVPGATRTAASELTTGVIELTLVNQDATGIDTTVGLAPGAAWVRTESGVTPSQEIAYTQFMPAYDAQGGGIGQGDNVPVPTEGTARMKPIVWTNDGDGSASAGFKVTIFPYKPNNEKSFDPEAYHRNFATKYSVNAHDGKKYWWVALHATGSANTTNVDAEYWGDQINIPSSSGASVNYSVSAPGGLGVSWSNNMPGPYAHTDGDWDGRYKKHYNYWWIDTNNSSSTEKKLYMQNWWSCPRSEGACKVYVFYDSYRD